MKVKNYKINEPKLGEEFTMGNSEIVFKCVLVTCCDDCIFGKNYSCSNNLLECDAVYRKDKKDVMFIQKSEYKND